MARIPDQGEAKLPPDNQNSQPLPTSVAALSERTVPEEVPVEVPVRVSPIIVQKADVGAEDIGAVALKPPGMALSDLLSNPDIGSELPEIPIEKIEEAMRLLKSAGMLPNHDLTTPLLANTPFPGFNATLHDPQAKEAVQQAVSIVAETEPFYDKDKDEWVRRPKGDIAQGDMIDRWIEGRNSNELSTEMYDPEHYSYYWVSIAKEGQRSETFARSLGYAPVRGRAETPSHMLKKVEGYGTCVNFGDLILYQCPVELTAARQKKRLLEKQEEAGKITNKHRGELANVIDGDRVFIVEEKYRRDMEQQVSLSDMTHAEAQVESLKRAEEYAGMRDEEGRRSSFGGFDGAMGQRAVPESPYLRR